MQADAEIFFNAKYFCLDLVKCCATSPLRIVVLNVPQFLSLALLEFRILSKQDHYTAGVTWHGMERYGYT